MYEPIFDTLLDIYCNSGEDTSLFPFASIDGGQEGPSQDSTVISANEPLADWSTGWSVAPLIEGPVLDVHADEVLLWNYASQHGLAPGVATENSAAVPFGALAPTCGLASGHYCDLPMDGSVRSIKTHLRMHGHGYLQRQTVRCPWAWCTDILQWVNIPRHIQTIHLGMRIECPKCGKPYTRREGLARHVASLKCSGRRVSHSEKRAHH